MTKPLTENERLRREARRVWLKYRNRLECAPTRRESATLINAYYAGVLPRDPDYSPHQWVEDLGVFRT